MTDHLSTTLSNSVAVLAKNLFESNPTRMTEHFAQLATFIGQISSGTPQQPYWSPAPHDYSDAFDDAEEEEEEPEPQPEPVPKPVVPEQVEPPKQVQEPPPVRTGRQFWADVVPKEGKEVNEDKEDKEKVVIKPIKPTKKPVIGKCFKCDIDIAEGDK